MSKPDILQAAESGAQGKGKIVFAFLDLGSIVEN
jgi:hypothetical protein